MYWIYIIKSKKYNQLYVGMANNLPKRLKEHNSGQSKHTNRYKPWTYVYVEGYLTRQDAAQREKNLKYHGKVYAQLL